jgi:DNA polymerase elongation subunit (family B)
LIARGYENALLLVPKAIDKIMIGGDDVSKNDLVISKLLGQNIEKYRSLFPHVSAAIQLSGKDKRPFRGDTIRYIYTDSSHKNPLCRVVPVENTYQNNTEEIFSYDKEKYREMILDAAETVFRIFWV